jgi:aspartyl-tRNA(Asn)/glutamyl-tRNA(Gln) amidotransferase subunit C
MPMTPAVLDHLAWLARLELTAEEKERLARDLDEFLAYFRILEAVATEGVAPFTPAPDQAPDLRADSPEPGATREEALGSAPERAGEFFAVPTVVERT